MSWFTQTWFLQGVMHPLLTPSHIILILGLVFLLGQQRLLKMFPVTSTAIISGLALNHYNIFSLDTELILLSLALICGLLLVLRKNLHILITTIALIISGVMLGLDSSPIMIPGLGTNSVFSWRLGAFITLTISITLLAIPAYFLEKYWNGIIPRVAGSWIATSAIFVLTLKLVGQ